MTCSRGALSGVVDHVAGVGSGRTARRAAAAWAQKEPALAGFGSPAAVAAACRSACCADQDRLLSALLGLAVGDQWAQLAALAGLADRLRWVVRRWAAAGMPAAVLADAEAELVAACWAAIAASAGDRPPDRPGLVLVDRAWETVRTRRRRDRRRHDRCCPLPIDMPQAPAAASTVSSGRPVLEVLAGQVTDAVRDRRLTITSARAVYLTRVSGLSTVEAGAVLGCAPGVLRAVRSRAERRLAA